MSENRHRYDPTVVALAQSITPSVFLQQIDSRSGSFGDVRYHQHHKSDCSDPRQHHATTQICSPLLSSKHGRSIEDGTSLEDVSSEGSDDRQFKRTKFEHSTDLFCTIAQSQPKGIHLNGLSTTSPSVPAPPMSGDPIQTQSVQPHGHQVDSTLPMSDTADPLSQQPSQTRQDISSEVERHLCFGMIQSLVVTLYPRQLEYEEGKSDPVIIKRTTTASKASLAVEHESGLYGYVVSELTDTLVPLADANMIWWEAHVPRQRKHNNVSVPLNLILYGPQEHQMAVAKALHGKVRLEDPIEFDHRTRYSNPLLPAPGERLSPYDIWRGVTTPPASYANGPSSKVHGYSGYGGSSSVRSAEEIKNQIDGVFKGLRSATDLPLVEPSPCMSTLLYKHQKQALYFLLEREKQEDYTDNEKNKLTSLWRVRHPPHGHPVYLNVVTNQESSTKPTSMRGGILADDMGLGKTITVISLIAATLDRGMYARAMGLLGTGASGMSSNGAAGPGPSQVRSDMGIPRIKSHATLIVCPLSTVQNWEEQFENHVQRDALQVYVYHGGQRVTDPSFLAKHDVVITTYNLLGTEYSKETKARDSQTGLSRSPSVLQHVDWFRVVLDEAHIIKEVNTVQSKAASALTAERRWCLTGTPIQNKLDDLFALIKFLRMHPFDEKVQWTHYISKPIKAANPIGITRLQTLMKVITLRRTKSQMVDGQPLLDLPTRTDHKRVLELSLNERQLYQRMESRAKQTVDQIVLENKIMKSYAHILQAILKLRQICAHYALVKNLGDDLDATGEFNLAKASEILTLLQDSGNDQCNHCFNSSTPTPIVTRCEHIFCPDCVKKLNPVTFMLIQRSNANVSVTPGLQIDFSCPQCSLILRPVDLIQIQDDLEDKFAAIGSNGNHIHTRKDENGALIHSTKVKALMEDLVHAAEVSKKTGEPLAKSVVFSQWTSMLDLIEDGLRENDIKFTRLDGTMLRSDRTTALTDFKDKPDIGVILISLKAGGVGLNLTSAQRVYLMDPHWNPAVESQAIDRIHRLGQTKPVDVVRFIIKDSIEENILDLQKRKAELSDMTFSEKLSKQEVLKRRLEDLRCLFRGSSELMKKTGATVE
ncbi:MAG: SNF2 family N-terminal domain-containing protein [Benniella sp.]|nr:MAG: SNF2 family N-terminal domain-containing protein [Benniella sp.]